MKYLDVRKASAFWAALFLFAPLPPFPASGSSPDMPPLPDSLDSLVPCLAARRLSVADFALSREKWAGFYGYRKLDVRVRHLNRDGAWVRVDFDRAREGVDSAREVFRMAWNEGEEGPAPFALNQRLAIWVSRDGNVDGFALGQSVHRWRHRPDGTVELQVLDEMVDGGTVLVRMVPDRYSGSAVGRTVYWKGEGLCTGALGAAPLGREILPEDLSASVAQWGGDGRKAVWVSPGMTSCEDEIRKLLRDFAEPVTVAMRGDGMVAPYKIRLRAESSGSPKKGDEKPASRGGAGWGRGTAPSAGRKSTGSAPGVKGVLASYFGKGKGEKDAPAVEEKEESPGTAGPDAGAQRASDLGAAGLQAGAAPQADASGTKAVPAGGTSPVPGPVAAPETQRIRVDERWFDVLRDKAVDHRREALEALTRTRSPGSAVSQTWVDVKYDNGPGEPLKAVVLTLPLVPIKQFVPDSREIP